MYPAEMSEDSYEGVGLDKSNSAGRAPKCRRCRNHNILSDLRGHKHQCRYKDCMCSKCVIVTDGQRQTAVRIALYRQQRNIETEMKINGSSYENGVDTNGTWPNGDTDKANLENGYTKRKYHSSDSGSNSPESDMSLSLPDSKRQNLDSPPTIRDGACNIALPMPKEVLSRAFPNHSPTTLELVLKGCNGNVLHAIEIISQYDKIPRIPLTAPGYMDSNAPAPNPHLLQPLYRMNGFPNGGGYRFLVPPGMVPFGSYMLPGMTPPPFGAVGPPAFAPRPDIVEEIPQHDTSLENGIDTISPKKEVDREHSDENSEINRKCETCGQGIKFGDRFCTNCSRRFSS